MTRTALRVHLVVPALLGIATALAYLGWLGWDQTKDLQPDGVTETGPYQSWQIIGLVAAVLALAVVGARVGTPWLAALAISVALAWSYGYDASHGPGDNGLWPLGAALIFIGSALATSLVAALAQRRSPTPVAA
jgi:hypothetical protein